MQSVEVDPAALGFTVISLNVALKEALKALAEKNGNQAGPWLDEVEELALLRAKSKLTGAQDSDAASAAIAAVESIFAYEIRLFPWVVTIRYALTIVLLSLLPTVANAQQATCKLQSVEKKLAVAQLTPFMQKCEGEAQNTCEQLAAARRLEEPAKTIFMTNCVKAFVG